MSYRLSLSVFTIEVDGKATLAFEAKRYSDAEAICGDEGLPAFIISKQMARAAGNWPVPWLHSLQKN